MIAPESFAALHSDADLAGGSSGAKRDALSTLPVGGESPTISALQTVGVAASFAPSSTGRVFYVDSRIGQDGNTGASAAGGGSTGPWKTLSRLTRASLLPGDTVRLACGAVWYEPLKLKVAGTAAAPIIMEAYPRGCANAPIIEGGRSIYASSWVRHSGNVYRSAVAFDVLDLLMDTTHMQVAHHPNRGFDPAVPDSMFLRTAADSNSGKINGRAASTFVTTGADLVVPAGVSLAAGAAVRVRTTSWTIDESPITAVSGNKLLLATPTDYPIGAGWGYYLVGQLWMLDSPGEWFYDKAAKTVYAWMSDSQPPLSRTVAIQEAVGIDLNSAKYIIIDGLWVRRMGIAISMRNSEGVVVRNSRIADTVVMGIDAAASRNAIIASNVIERTGSDALSGADDAGYAAMGMRVTDNRISQSGVLINGDIIASLPRRSFAAIRSGPQSTVSGNSVIDSGNIGIKIMAASTASGNYVRGACSVLDDCAGIYTSGANNSSVISGNIVEHSRGSLWGKPPTQFYTQAQGIYLDESASGVTVSGNTVIDADNGIQVHVSSNNLIQDNKLYGNRNNQLWLQETRNRDNPNGDVFGNRVLGNQIVNTQPTSAGVYQTTIFTNTFAFAYYDHNKYFDRVFRTIGYERNASAYSNYDLFAWKSATTDAGTPRNLDANGSGALQLKYATNQVVGANIVPNGKLAADRLGWTSWNESAPFGNMTREACASGYCASYAAGGSPGILSTPNFSVQRNQWYRLSFDLRAGSDGQFQAVVVRNGGGGSAGYERLSDVPLSLVASRAWKRYSFLFQAVRGAVVNDPLTRGLGARIDFERVMPGTTLSVTNLEMVAVTPAAATTRTDILLNAGVVAVQRDCPVASTSPAQCGSYLSLNDDSRVTWPRYMAPMSSEIIYTLDAGLVDSDGDGIADAQDACPNSPNGSAVSAAGCALGQ